MIQIASQMMPIFIPMSYGGGCGDCSSHEIGVALLSTVALISYICAVFWLAIRFNLGEIFLAFGLLGPLLIGGLLLL